eukprot:GFYU01012333.1.p1 GENE.GFYU01012333.1~~GFYU01012333.1.p1  ORF type:complete len:349 (+),score=108.28 GFYU01012333.1:64-1110(+)
MSLAPNSPSVDAVNSPRRKHAFVKGGAFKLFAGNSNPELAQKVASHLGVELGGAKIKRFNDGEISIQITENVRNADIYLIQSTCSPVNENLMELLLLVRTFKRASANTVTAIIPYYGYARQDRKMEPRVPISASDVALFLEAAGVDRVLAIDLHCGQIQGYFHTAPVDNLFALVDQIPYVGKNLVPKMKGDICCVSPDAGGVARAKMFMEGLAKFGVEASLAITIKQRARAGEVESMNVVGDIKDKHCLIIDDMIDTAGTLCKSAQTLLDLGALSVSACVTHPVFSGPALDRIAASALDYVIVSDTIPLKGDNITPKIVQVSCARLLAEALRAIQEGASVSSLFKVAK